MPASPAESTPAGDRRTVIVTGGARGIGAAAASRFAAEGARVVLGDLDGSVVDAARDLQRRHPHSRVEAVVGDVRDAAHADRLVATAAGPVDALVLAAGVLQRPQSIGELEPEQWERILSVNATGSFLVASAVAPVVRRPGGRVVFVSSIAGVAGIPMQAAYSASKAAVRALSQSLALELAPEGITVNAVAPGFIDTDMGREALENLALLQGGSADDIRRKRESRIPARRLGVAEEVAGVIAFLASVDAGYITGATLDVNGGVIVR